MDFHAHLAKTEVIGLLGGLFDPEHRRLHVRMVFPCNSLSTGLQVRLAWLRQHPFDVAMPDLLTWPDNQCEMDPASEMAARDAFASYVHVHARCACPYVR